MPRAAASVLGRRQPGQEGHRQSLGLREPREGRGQDLDPRAAPAAPGLWRWLSEVSRGSHGHPAPGAVAGKGPRAPPGSTLVYGGGR